MREFRAGEALEKKKKAEGAILSLCYGFDRCVYMRCEQVEAENPVFFFPQRGMLTHEYAPQSKKKKTQRDDEVLYVGM